jgi:polysaccharide export outer membrane protein
MGTLLRAFIAGVGALGVFCVHDASAQSAATPVQPPAQAPIIDRDYRVGPQDVLKITVFGESQLSGPVRVDSDGTIPFQYLQRIKADGHTVAEIAENIRKGLADGYIRNPQVSVEVDQYHSQNVYVMGEVRAPGKYVLPGNSTLVDVLTQAGSTTTSAGHWVLIFHHKEGTAPVGPADPSGSVPDIRISLADIQSGKAQNIKIEDLDAVSVPKADRVFVNGNVRTPGAYTFDDGMTVFEAVAIAGGVSEKGSNSRISVKRMIGGKLKEIDVKPTDILKPNDQVFVKARRL